MEKQTFYIVGEVKPRLPTNQEKSKMYYLFENKDYAILCAGTDKLIQKVTVEPIGKTYLGFERNK